MSTTWKISGIALLALACAELAWLMCEPGHSAAAVSHPVSRSVRAPAGALIAFSAPPTADKSELKLSPDRSVSATPEAELAAAMQISARADRLNALDRILGEWAARSPAAALAWARAQDPAMRQSAIVITLRGMGAQPDAALRLGLLLVSQDPEHANDDALAVIQGLGNARQFAAAMRFANAVPSDSREDWLASIFNTWGAADPASAMQALAGEPAADHAALFHALAEGWSTAQPASLADRALALPPGPDRDCALSLAEDRWSMQDPAAFSAWLGSQQPGPQFDTAIAALLTRTDGANRPPELAMDWTQRITDAGLRFSTVKELALQWSKEDAPGALSYVQWVSWIEPAQRAEIVGELKASTGRQQED